MNIRVWSLLLFLGLGFGLALLLLGEVIIVDHSLSTLDVLSEHAVVTDDPG